MKESRNRDKIYFPKIPPNICDPNFCHPNIYDKSTPLAARASIPLQAMMHFPPCFRYPPCFRKICQTPQKIVPILPFLKKNLGFHPPKFLMTFFLVIDHKFRISPLFSLFSTFPPCFAKIILSLLLLQISPPVLNKFTCFLHTLHVFRFPPYFDHEAFMHHPMHVLDTPVCE